MRIAHITATFPPYYSGTGMVCYHNALGLARRGHSVTVITAAHPPGSYEYPAEFAVRRLPVLFRLGNAPLLPQLLGLNEFDIVHLHHPFIFGAELLWLATRLRGIPLVLTHHNDLIGDGLRPALFAAYSAISSRLLATSVRRFGVVSLDHAAACRLTPLLRRRWQDVVEIPNGIDTGLFHPQADSAAVRARHGIAPDAPLVLFVGALDRAHHFKGAGLLLEAFAMLRSPTAQLLLVGDGELRAGFVARAAALGIAQQVHFAGAVANQQLPAYYCAANMLVLPTAPPESFGMVLIEALACGTPVITSNIPGVRSVVSAGEDGLLTNPGDVPDIAAKMALLLADPLRQRAMGQHGRTKVEQRYAWPTIIPQLERMYEEVLYEAARRRSHALWPEQQMVEHKPAVAGDDALWSGRRPSLALQQALDGCASQIWRTGGSVALLAAQPVLATELRRRTVGCALNELPLALPNSRLEQAFQQLVWLAPQPAQAATLLQWARTLLTAGGRLVILCAGWLSRLRPQPAMAQVVQGSMLLLLLRHAGFRPDGVYGYQSPSSIGLGQAAQVCDWLQRPALADRCTVAMRSQFVATGRLALFAPVVLLTASIE